MIGQKLSAYWRHIKLIHLCVLAATLTVAIHYFALPKITSRTVQYAGQEGQVPILLPQMTPDYFVPGISKNHFGRFEYNFTIRYQKLQQTRFAFFAVGCVDKMTLNNINVPLHALATCNIQPGFIVDLGPYLLPGDNQLKIELTNIRNFRGSRPYDTASFGLQMGPKFINLGKPGLTELLISALLLTCCLIITRIMWFFTGTVASGLIISGGLLAYVRHFLVTNFMQYTIDMPSHLQYIIFIANHRVWPKTYHGWEYYHPPFYYHLEAMVIWVTNWLGSFDSISMMRLFSLLCFMTFIILSALILHRVIATRVAYYCALILLVFYPTGIIFATRLDSHILYYALYAACTYFLLCWIQDKKHTYLWYALIASGFAIGTRTNGLVLAPIIGLAAFYQWRKGVFSFSDLRSAHVALSLFFILMGLLGNFGRTAYYHITENNTMPFIVGNIASIQPSQYITTTLEHLLLVDTQQLFTPPFITWWHDHLGRQYFWTSMLKTSLFEHFTWNAMHHAKLLLFLLLALIGYIAVSACTQTIQKRLEWRVCSATLFIAIAMLMINRVMHPYAPSQDFRYIYPALVSFCAMVGLIIEQQLANQKYTGAAAGIVMAVAFSCCSFLLISAG